MASTYGTHTTYRLRLINQSVYINILPSNCILWPFRWPSNKLTLGQFQYCFGVLCARNLSSTASFHKLNIFVYRSIAIYITEIYYTHTHTPRMVASIFRLNLLKRKNKTKMFSYWNKWERDRHLRPNQRLYSQHTIHSIYYLYVCGMAVYYFHNAKSSETIGRIKVNFNVLLMNTPSNSQNTLEFLFFFLFFLALFASFSFVYPLSFCRYLIRRYRH